MRLFRSESGADITWRRITIGLFSKKVDYDELYRKLSTEKMTVREREKAVKLLDKLEDSGDRRGIF